ncbi:GNAT family N-acetyltransferase [Streptomyces sp. NPDC002763]|uniref:GNAT family N-acetyltransferase n=1 Tax=Streptomyces sp. NPDC002763 TaxID=3154427 RepID=UPI00332BEEEC
MIDVLVLDPDDWRLWRDMRLAALREARGVFASSLADWSGPGDTEARWRARLGDVPFNALLRQAGRAVGMVSATDPGSHDVVELISLWVSPTARGHGVGDAAVTAVTDWAHQHHLGCPVGLWVRTDNTRAQALFLRNGFMALGRAVDGEHRMTRPPVR